MSSFLFAVIGAEAFLAGISQITVSLVVITFELNGQRRVLLTSCQIRPARVSGYHQGSSPCIMRLKTEVEANRCFHLYMNMSTGSILKLP